MMNEDGSDVMQLASMGYDVGQPDWSPDGMRIVAARDYTAIVVMDADGSNVQQITDEVAPVIEQPAWSPDGSRIAFSIKQAASGCLLSDYNIYVADPDGGNRVKLTDGCGGRNTEVDWSPDGSKIVFTSRRDSPQDIDTNLRDIEIYVMNADGSDETRLTFDGAENEQSPV